MMDEERDLPEEEEDLYVLSDNEGEDVTFRQIARIELEGSVYALLELVDDDEGSAMVFSVETDENGEESLMPVDEELGEELFYLFLSENEDYEYGEAQ